MKYMGSCPLNRKDRGMCACLTFWDLGSKVTLVTTQYAQEQKLPGWGAAPYASADWEPDRWWTWRPMGWCI
jgi:hypothetical protein